MIKAREGELLSKANIKNVIEQLSQDKPITKRDACSLLNINYNTSRLAKILEEFQENESYSASMRIKMRKQPFTIADETYIVSAYLDNEPLSAICETTFRSSARVKDVLSKYNVPLREPGNSYHNPPEVEVVADDYKEGDLVYAARYSSPAYIRKLHTKDSFHGNVYAILLTGTSRQAAYQPYYELADLRKLQTELGVSLSDLSKEEVNSILRDTLSRVNKRK